VTGAADVPRDALRVCRYLDGELIETSAVAYDDVDDTAERHGDWARLVAAAGHRYRVVIDDPAGDLPAVVVLEGGPT